MLTKQHRQTREIHASVSCQKQFKGKENRHQRTAVETGRLDGTAGCPSVTGLGLLYKGETDKSWQVRPGLESDHTVPAGANPSADSRTSQVA